MDEKFAVLSKGPNFNFENGYNTLRQAREDGALVLAYGYVTRYSMKRGIWIQLLILTRLRSAFIETLLNFLGVSLTLYAVGHLYMLIFQNKIIKPTVRCPYCKQFIGEAVRGST